MAPVKRLAHKTEVAKVVVRPDAARVTQVADPRRALVVPQGNKIIKRKKVPEMMSQKLTNLGMMLDNADLKRRKVAIEKDKERLKKLMEEINSDPPPIWTIASLKWQDIYVLERRIDAFEKVEAEGR